MCGLTFRIPTLLRVMILGAYSCCGGASVDHLDIGQDGGGVGVGGEILFVCLVLSLGQSHSVLPLEPPVPSVRHDASRGIHNLG